MPGGRLTHQDRQLIAEGLAEGLTYTEIAARLGRPISTVTREVGRNGGADGYRADLAQRATQGRARRSRPTAGRGSDGVSGAAAPGRDREAVRELEEQFTEVMVGSGLPRMTARVLTSLYLTDSGSMTAAELAGRLEVSPASISKAIGELEQQRLVRRERDPRRRRDRYIIDATAWFGAWMSSARQNAVLADFAERGAAILGATTPAGARLQDMSGFFDTVGRAMIEAAERWRDDYLASRPPGE
ncbi:GbsR/MarR family transcriptional regulator [Nonomuraea soli]|uniref:DNA-binding transcriptional ArsR family regulator n=1 Tax=Nonomuraea soli TaxID=1032476 RepID=A0A7W0CUT0_9ACTN|nr:helix-turn-helix domain-containing protein [Nonomuraea soli]MBA2897575.1 DNA-binding transcriptional ArsR family regulator [Nonomuraea soli]